ncbi:pilus assembly protein TadG-related protein [Gulosibacter molinativorax]|uniref:Putative Flp pilus-assembly TadG-like N-terminal domain-containing protein n=1 Tax=Gulosibacter molinativorax TaxID=256821 RepID=A0ABT7CBC6_9MICO|nr:pilus assembly protein TadG-related protein [Gulosibacter molinativorax]MDJ1372502.1 hypothetical protein [Gulosibacter molinativorax]QUY61920.1 Hypotetical protein [Gulosibacter molinativorax]
MTRIRGLGQRIRGERGSITPLAIIYAVIALAAALLLFAAADLYLERKQLLTHADAAALAAANSFEFSEIESADGTPNIQLDHENAVAAAEEYLATHAAGEAMLTHVTVDGDSVTIYVEGQWQSQVGGVFLPVSVPLGVEVSARALFQ